MKQNDIIRLGIIAMALFLAYNGIIYLIEFINFIFAWAIASEHGSGGSLLFILKIACFFVASFLLIKNSRGISTFIDEQK